MDATTQPRKMSDLTVEELLRSAQSETVGLGALIDREVMPLLTGEDHKWTRTLLNAYLGSIGSRIANAEMKVAGTATNRPATVHEIFLAAQRAQSAKYAGKTEKVATDLATGRDLVQRVEVAA
jgi:hypothetical protein